MAEKYTITLDDDTLVARIIEKATGIKSIAFSSAQKLVNEAQRYHPLAAFIDIHLDGGESGLQILPNLRTFWPYTPLLVITKDPTDEAVEKALDSGADDFIQKPLRPKELIARLRTRMDDLEKRQAKTTFHFGDIAIDTANRLLRGPKGKAYLSPTEAHLLVCLIQSKGTVVPKEKLKRVGWKKLAVGANALDRKLFELRRALADVSATVRMRSVYGAGVALRN